MTGSRRLVLVVMCAGYFLVLLDVTVVNVALPRIGAGLGAGVTGLQWVVDGYAVAPAALIAAPQAYRTRGRTAGLPNLQPRRATMAA
jgi:MFS family permease